MALKEERLLIFSGSGKLSIANHGGDFDLDAVEENTGEGIYPKLLGYLFLTLNFVLTMLSLWTSPFSHFLAGHDASMFLYFGQGMNHGLVPYRDMFDHKGIVLYWIQQLGVCLNFGRYDSGIWLIECVFYLVTLIFMFRTIVFLTKRPLMAGVLLFLATPLSVVTFDFGDYSEEFALTLITIALYFFIRLIVTSKLNWRHLIGIGICGGLTFFIRPNMITLWVVFCGYLLIKLLIQKKFAQLGRIAGGIFLGGAAVCVLVFIYALVVDNLDQMIYQTFTVNSEYALATTWTDRYLAAQGFFGLANKTGISSVLIIYGLTTFLNLDRLRDSRWQLRLVIVIFAAVNFLTVILSGRYYAHYFITMIPSVVLMAALSVDDILRMALPHSRVKYAIIGLLMVPALFGIRDVGHTNMQVSVTTPNYRQTGIDVQEARYIKARTRPEDPIYIHRINANIYLLSDRFANSRFFTLPSLDYTYFPKLTAEFKQKLTNNRPKFIAIQRILYTASNLNDAHLDKMTVTFIQQHYTPVKKFQNTDILLFQLNK
jgi:hypothetical protein